MNAVKTRIEFEFQDQTEEFLQWVEERGLVVKEMGTAQYQGGRHWHFSKPGKQGVVELTWWPDKRAMWVEVRTNRQGEWIEGFLREVEVFGNTG